MNKLKITTLAIILLVSCFKSTEVNSTILPALSFPSLLKPGTDPSIPDFIKGGTSAEFTSKGWAGSNYSLEKNLQMENWMLETTWSEKFEFINESELQLETWMVEFDWVRNDEDFSESGLNLESWMFKPQGWKLPPAK